MSAKLKWTLAIVGLLVANIVAMVILASSAGVDLVPGYQKQPGLRS